MQQSTKICPVCCLEVNGFVEQIDSDVSSPLRPIQESTIILEKNSAYVTQPPSRKLDLSTAFNVKIVPKIETMGPSNNRQPVYLETTREKKDNVANGSDSNDSDIEELTNPALVHYPPLPVIGTSNQPLSGETLSPGESQSEGEGGLPSNFTHEGAIDLVTAGTMDSTEEGVDNQKVGPKVKDSKVTRNRQIPTSPSLTLRKRITRAEVADSRKTLVVKKKKRRKKAPPTPKAFNSLQ
jgi:hypothetical protein